MKGIIDLIHSKNKTVTAAAKACDITSASLYNYDKGTDMSLSTAIKLAGFLEVEIAEFWDTVQTLKGQNKKTISK